MPANRQEAAAAILTRHDPQPHRRRDPKARAEPMRDVRSASRHGGEPTRRAGLRFHRQRTGRLNTFTLHHAAGRNCAGRDGG